MLANKSAAPTHIGTGINTDSDNQQLAEKLNKSVNIRFKKR